MQGTPEQVNKWFATHKTSVIQITIPEMTPYLKEYYTTRGIKVFGDKISIPIKKKVVVEPFEGKSRVLIYSKCRKLKNNLCSIWENRPSICDKTRRPKDVVVYVFPECTDEVIK